VELEEVVARGHDLARQQEVQHDRRRPHDCGN
jgi:hypothetical protein